MTEPKPPDDEAETGASQQPAARHALDAEGGASTQAAGTSSMATGARRSRLDLESLQAQVDGLQDRVSRLEASGAEFSQQLSGLLAARRSSAQRALLIRLAVLVLLVLAYLAMRQGILG